MATTRSFRVMVIDADPDFFERQRAYVFNAHSETPRIFYEPSPTVTAKYLVDAAGRYILTADGKKIYVRT